ncbi:MULTISPECIES: Uma2 family endonuclease [unclassified Streptomyces]|uniref:Uma2 family endonuclease n=1 Tax=unclassified Streptomyces TaxID=2593676 RepID=UPI00081E169F|nr:MULTISPECIES: Uma2 family endonuclease [unclassified Streptomyces]MYZ38935.1 Uma2 family endonuclease [Streptomyces sp. SID4917]SCG01200.1 Putative restriction endonuclease [Streptomyces sp. MnatMP-M17]
MTVMLERPTIDGNDPRRFEELCKALDQLNVPDGFKAEIIRGNIVASPWSKAYYLDVMDLICDQLRPHLPEGHRVSSAPALYVFPGVERAYGPDVHAADRRTRRTTSRHLDGEGLSFIAELTSASTRDADLVDKVERYGKAGVPVYLLLDMQEDSATVFWSPTAKGYASHLTVPFGKEILMPAPFNCTLSTAGFQAPFGYDDD